MRPQWLTMEEAKEHCAKGLSKWEFASNDNKGTDIGTCFNWRCSNTWKYGSGIYYKKLSSGYKD